jgi:hypothetical protein
LVKTDDRIIQGQPFEESGTTKTVVGNIEKGKEQRMDGSPT